VELSFQGRVWEWRGPAPYHFVSIPAEHVDAVNDLAPGVTYGWGMVPVDARLGRTCWRTSLSRRTAATSCRCGIPSGAARKSSWVTL
jgi:Domain of unknown function (DUF1905)